MPYEIEFGIGVSTTIFALPLALWVSTQDGIRSVQLHAACFYFSIDWRA